MGETVCRIRDEVNYPYGGIRCRERKNRTNKKETEIAAYDRAKLSLAEECINANPEIRKFGYWKWKISAVASLVQTQLTKT